MSTAVDESSAPSGIGVGRLRLSPIGMKQVLVAAAVLVVWQIVGTFSNPLLLPTPTAVVAAFFDLVINGGLVPAFLSSLRLLAIGFLAACVLGTVLGIALGRYHLLDITFGPYINALYATPLIALVPLILVWLGFGLSGRLVVVVLASFFPVMLNTYAGIREAPSALIEVARSFGVRSEFALLRSVVIPSAVPFIMAGLRLSIGRGVVGMALAEVYLRLGGIGEIIVAYGAVFKTAHVIAAIAPLPILAILLTKLLGYLERRIPWSTTGA